MQPPPRSCQYCGQPIPPTADRRQKFCAQPSPCRTRFGNEKRRVATGPIVRRGARASYERLSACLHCGGDLQGRRRRFCSETCAEVYWNVSRRKGIAETQHRISDLNVEKRTATCLQCGPGIAVVRSGHRWGCRVGHYTPARLRQQRESGWRKRGIDLTYDQYERILEQQGHACAICRDAFNQTPAVDHCHGSGVVRGLLCDNCNHMLGKSRDDPERLRAAALYLEGHS